MLGHERRLERLEARIPSSQKELLQRAASLRSQSLTEFVIASAHSAALQTIAEHELVTLCAQDSEAFVRALIKPPAPNRKLRNAARRFSGRN